MTNILRGRREYGREIADAALLLQFNSTLEIAHACEEVGDMARHDIELLKHRGGSGAIGNLACGCARTKYVCANQLRHCVEFDSHLHSRQCRK